MDSGLENVIAAETCLSDVDGKGGNLIVRGHRIETLAATSAYEDVVQLVWEGMFPDLPGTPEIGRRLAEARVRAYQSLSVQSGSLNIVQALRSGWSQMADDETLATAFDLAGAATVITAAALRRARGLDVVAPDSSLSHSADFLRMMTGQTPDHLQARALDSYLVTVCDHGLNASTFAARVIASTRAGLGSAVIGGLSALKGPLHGGAPGPVLDMLDQIATPENAENWIDAALGRGERLMGFGHRVYRVRDPRADALKRALRQLPGTSGRIRFAEHIESEVLGRLHRKYPTRSLETNVEFYTALLLEALEIPREAFTAIFACGRVVGWIAHAREQIADGRLVRPQSVYCGPLPEAA